MTETKPLNAQKVAEYFLWKGQLDRKPITNKKLQKLLYYAQAWSLVVREKKLFNEKIEAWVHGPAIRKIYLEYKTFGFDPIKKEIETDVIEKIPADIRNFLDQMWSAYGKYDAAFLEYLSHSEEPWQKARESLEPHTGSEKEITPESMQSFYSQKLAHQPA